VSPNPVETSASPSPAGPPLYGESPFFLDVEGGPLYAVHHPAAPGPTASLAVLVVPPLAGEQLSGYRCEVLLARELARRGVHALRFHPRGQGDSGGPTAALTLPTFAADVGTALAELRRRSGDRPWAAVGLRFGALALARAMAAADPPRAIALWEPVHDPTLYFRELLRSVVFSETAKGQRSGATVDTMLAALERDGVVDVLGYPLHRELVRSATHGLADALGAWAGPTQITQIDARRSLARPHAQLAEHLRARGAEVDVREARAELSWYFLQNPAWENAELVSGTADWMLAHA